MSLRRNALLLVLATGLLAILGEWGGAGLVRLWRVPAALLLLGLAYEGWVASRARPQLSLQTAARWFLARTTRIVLQVTVAQRSTSLQIALAAPVEFTMDREVRTLEVRANQPATLPLSAAPRRLGDFIWPAMSARIAGVLGLAWWPQQLVSGTRVQVVPDALAEAERAPGNGERGIQPASRQGSGAEILQLRAWRVGDAPRQIDWKASARLQRLTSRDYIEEQHLTVALAIDVGRSSGFAAGHTDRLALYANVAARFAQRALQLEDSVALLLYAERPLLRLAPARGAAALLRLRAALGAMRVHESDANARLAAASLRDMLGQRSLIVMLTDLDDAGTIAELVAGARLLLPKHLPFIAGVRSLEAAEVAQAHVGDAAHAYRALAAQEYLASVDRNVRALQALGAAAVLAAPQQLEQAVIRRYREFRQRRRVA